MNMTASLATVSYIGATILFILCLGGLSNQETSRRGNLYGMIGTTIASATSWSSGRSRSIHSPSAFAASKESPLLLQNMRCTW